MKFEWFIAGRYFKSSRKGSSFLSFIKIISVTGVAVGAAGLLIALSVVHGFKSTIEEKILGFGNHITVMSHTTQPIFRADTLVTFLSAMPEIAEVQAVIEGQGMIQAGNRVDGGIMKGVSRDGDVSDLRSYVVQGTYDLTTGPDDDLRPGVVIGSRMAQTLGASPGQTITIYTVSGTPGPGNLPEIMQFRLSGIYQTGIDKFDDALVLMDIQHARRLFEMPEPVADMIDIRVHNLADIPALHERLFEELRFPFYNETIYQRYSSIFAWINLQEQTIPFVISVMIIVAAFNLIGAILMMVLERTRDIGILKTMGASDGSIKKIFMLEGLMVGVAGLVIGIGLSLLFNWIQGTWEVIPLSEENYYMSTAPVEPHLLDFVLVTAITIFLCAIASWLPARVASKTDPLKVIQFGR